MWLSKSLHLHSRADGAAMPLKVLPRLAERPAWQNRRRTRRPWERRSHRGRRTRRTRRPTAHCSRPTTSRDHPWRFPAPPVREQSQRPFQGLRRRCATQSGILGAGGKRTRAGATENVPERILRSIRPWAGDARTSASLRRGLKSNGTVRPIDECWHSFQTALSVRRRPISMKD